MSTQFFERQDRARANTGWLVTLFTVAVVGLVGASAAVGLAVGMVLAEKGAREAQARQVGLSRPDNLSRPGSPQSTDRRPVDAGSAQVSPWLISAAFAGTTAAVILIGSFYQVTLLRWGGGTRVAESVGGTQLTPDTSDPAERRLLNIVEEMAIASGTPVPPVYLLDESAVNAFAAGYTPGDAVIGVTRGALEQLNREQLQGVIAHEFSHVFNGDMRLNINMIGTLHGILLLSLIGHMLFRSIYFVGGSRSSRSDRGQGGVVIAMAASGLALIIIGAVGSFVGGLIKAAVSRQREYLADASAVQFTRNPAGIAGALKRIGGFSRGGRLQHPNASMASHMYFAQGVFEGLTGLLATHPPLERRILALEPNWDGNFPEVSAAEPSSEPRVAAHAVAGLAGASGFAGAGESQPASQSGASRQSVSSAALMAAASEAGLGGVDHQEQASEFLRRLDPVLLDAAHETYSARALVLALLVDEDESIRRKQFAELERLISTDVVELTRKLLPKVTAMSDAARLPLVDLALPMLKMMTIPQYSTFIAAFEALVKADDRLSVFEWTLSQVLIRHLRSQYVASGATVTLYHRLGKLGHEVSVLLSVLAWTGQRGDEVGPAFAAGAERLPGVSLRLLERSECSLAALEQALTRLSRASGHRRWEVLSACAAVVCADGIVKVREAELLRGIADLLECPMPPLVGEIEHNVPS